MEQQFNARFASWTYITSVADLVSTQRKDNEEVMDHITRWHNLSIKCGHAMDPVQAIGVLVSNMRHQICSANINNFDELISQVKNDGFKFPNLLHLL